MKSTIHKVSITRRSMLTVAGLVTASLIAPRKLYASSASSFVTDPSYDSIRTIEDFSNRTKSELESIVLERAKIEGEQFIESLNASIQSPSVTRGRPYYENVYGPVTYTNSGFRFVDGQPANGYSFSNGGTIYVELTGGFTVGISFSFPLSFGGSAGASVSFARTVPSPGIGVDIPAGGRKKVKANVEYASTPYTTYYVDAYGNRSVYAHLHSYPVVSGRDFDVVNV